MEREELQLANEQPVKPAPQQPQQIKITPEMLNANNYPKAALFLSAFGGMLMFFEGLAAIFFRSLYYGINEDLWAGLSWVLIGIILLFIGSIIAGAAMTLLLKPELRKTAGASIIIFSIVGLLFGGGWILGSVLGIIGGLLAIIWKPKPDQKPAEKPAT
jgi:hypothetical protein